MTEKRTDNRVVEGVWPLCCVVTAAGAAKRYGGEKLTEPFMGKPLAAYILEALAELPFQKRFLVLQSRHTTLAALGEENGFMLLNNDQPELGMSRSVRLGLEAARAESPLGVLYSVADQPFLTAELIRALSERFLSEPAYFWAPSHQGQRGNPVYFPKWSFDELAAISGDRGGGALLQRHPDRIRLMELDEEAPLFDLDTPEERARAERRANTFVCRERKGTPCEKKN